MGESSTFNYSLEKKRKRSCGSNCCIPLCSTNNASCRGLSFMRLPRLGVSVEQDEWRRRLQHAISRCDALFNPDKAVIMCSRHFEEDCIKYGPSGKCTGLVFGSMPTRWMSPKSVVTPKTTRPEPKFREPSVVPERVCYKSLIDVVKDLAKIPAMWIILRKSEDVLDLGLVSDSSDVQVKVSLSALTDLQARVYVLQMPAPHLSRDLQKTRLPVFLQELSQKPVCTGITETELQGLAELEITSCQYFRHITYVLSDSKLKTASCARSTACLLLLEGGEAVCTMRLQAKQRLEKIKIKHEARLQNPLKQNDSLRGLSVEDLKELFKQERKEKLNLEALLIQQSQTV